IACLSDDAVDLIREIGERDPELAVLLTEICKLVHFSCDPRKGKRWLTAAMYKAWDEGVAFDVDHLLATAVECLSVGIKTTFSEGQDPHLQSQLEGCVEAIAGRALRSGALQKLLEERASRQAKEESSEGLAAELAALLFRDGKARQELVQRLLTGHERSLREDEVTDREVRGQALREFLRRMTRID